MFDFPVKIKYNKTTTTITINTGGKNASHDDITDFA